MTSRETVSVSTAASQMAWKSKPKPRAATPSFGFRPRSTRSWNSGAVQQPTRTRMRSFFLQATAPRSTRIIFFPRSQGSWAGCRNRGRDSPNAPADVLDVHGTDHQREGRAGPPAAHERQDYAGALHQIGARERTSGRRILGSVVEEEAERFRNAGELNSFEPNSMTRPLVRD